MMTRCSRARARSAWMSTGATGAGRGTHRQARVRRTSSTGTRSGVNGTPTFYINGVRHDADYDTARS